LAGWSGPDYDAVKVSHRSPAGNAASNRLCMIQ
jgi:hypothetical protein